MKKLLTLFALGTMFVLFSAFTPPRPEIKLNIKTTLVSGNAVKVGYEIPYEGYLEFHLLDKEGKEIWVNYWVAEKGEHFLPFSRKPLKEGETYDFVFHYKGQEFKGKFTNS